jgi:predicted secreted protein
MSLTSIAAIYLLFWVITAFVVMPFGVRTADEMGVEMVRGQAESAPANFRPGRVILFTTLISAAVFGLFYANYLNGWISPSDVNVFGRPPVS